MNRSPNIAFFSGTVIIAIMVMIAFANMAIAGGYSTNYKFAETTPKVI
ncbi:hypothetical protein [Synechococcus sp. M16CYN]